MPELVGADKVIKMLKELPRETRKAASGAINETLKEVQEVTGNQILPDAFTLRGRGKQWWEPGQKFGFNIRPYSNPDTLEGKLGSQADWLKLQEHGGTKQVDGHRLAIPSETHKPKAEILPSRKRPSRLLARKSSGVFKGDVRGFAGVFQRLGSGLKLLFALRPSARITPVLNFEKQAGDLANRRFIFFWAVHWSRVVEKHVKK